MPFHTSADASVSVRVETASFGPVRADAQGNVTIPIVVPPGVRDGFARATDADGNTRETTVDLQPAPFAQMLIVTAPQLEVGSFSEVSTFGVTTRGEPIAQGSTTLRASEGMVHPSAAAAPGEERFLLEAPQKVGSRRDAPDRERGRRRARAAPGAGEARRGGDPAPRGAGGAAHALSVDGPPDHR